MATGDLGLPLKLAVNPAVEELKQELICVTIRHLPVKDLTAKGYLLKLSLAILRIVLVCNKTLLRLKSRTVNGCLCFLSCKDFK